MTMVLSTLPLVLLCLIFEGFFSGAEIGVVSADRTKLRHDAAKGSRGAKLALDMLQRPEWLLSTTLVGTNIAVVTNTTIVTALVIELFGSHSHFVAVLFAAPLIWIFGEIVPKSVFQQRANILTPKVIFALNFFSYLFYPILLVFSFLAKGMAWLVGSRHDANPFTLREEIATMVQMPAQEGDIQPLEQKMIGRMFHFGETTAGEIMVPLIDVVGIETSSKVGDAIALAHRVSHHQIPVYSKRVDQVVGILDCLELLGCDPTEPIASHVKEVDYVPETKTIQDLLMDMRLEGRSMAVVVDEFGGAEGIVTVQDIIEEVVEDIEDEYDAGEDETRWIRKLGDQDYHVSARVEMEMLAEQTGVSLPDGNFATLAGFLLDRARDIPSTGDTISYKGIKFRVEKATPRAIQEVRITW